jgi:hypothetical protein
MKFHGKGIMGEQYGQPAAAGDVMACQYDTERGELVFSKNGESFGMAFFFPIAHLICLYM